MIYTANNFSETLSKFAEISLAKLKEKFCGNDFAENLEPNKIPKNLQNERTKRF
jgi:hypothetical protein